MYQGLRNTKIDELVEKLENEKLLKRDMVVPSNCISMVNGRLEINDLPTDMFQQRAIEDLLDDFGIETASDGIHFDVTDVARSQLSTKLKIPARYYKYLQADHIDLLDHNVSSLLNRVDKNYFVRTFAPSENSDDGFGLLRSFLSDHYQVVDNLDVLYSALQAIKETGADVKVQNCNLTEKRMYIEFMRPDVAVTAEDYFNRYQSPDGGDNGSIYSGFVISNSEVGAGAYKIVPRAIVGACKNGLIFKRDAMSKTHLGSRMGEGIRWSSDTKQKELDLIKSQITDAVTHFMSADFLTEKVNEISEHTERLDHPTQALENVCGELAISKEEKADVLNYFIDGGDFSPVGAVQAVTYHAHEQENADKQYDLESDVMELLPEFRERFDYAEK